MTILDMLAEHARERTAAAEKAMPAEEIMRRALSLPKKDFEFEKALGEDK